MARIVRLLAPWLMVGLLGSLPLLPSALAQSGADATQAVPVARDGSFVGSVAGGSSLWYVFGYGGGDTQVTVTITYLPPDANQMDLLLYTGDARNPIQQNIGSQQNGNTRSSVYKDPNAHTVYLRVINNNANRAVNVTGTVAPSSALVAITATPTFTPAGATATPVPATMSASPSPTAPSAPATGVTPGPNLPGLSPGETAPAAVATGSDGAFSGTIATRRAVWYRFWYGNPGANATVAVSVSPNADNADLNLYTGSDPNNLTQQPGLASKAKATLSRDINLPHPQFVYFAVANNNDTTILAYNGTVIPAFPAPTLTPTTTGTSAATPAPSPTTTPPPTAAPTSLPPTATSTATPAP
jgi:hypothetical protein